MARSVHVVPHTHWDREWYRSYQTFRMQLVDLLDQLLPAMAADPAYAHFMLDGQMAVVDDYLEVRPEAEPLIRRLAATGRVSMGPWYILMDEFLVSGETMIRNLQLGLDKAAAFGGAMEVGYLPDMFGHIAQMPQLLRQFGFADTVVWRGVPAAIDRAAFRWIAPDGSEVRAAFLATGYSNGALLPGDAKELVGMIDGFCREQGARAGSPVLWMNGTDHLLPQPHLGRVVSEANAVQDDYRIEVTSLADHLVAARAADAVDPAGALPEWHGELRSGARSNLLMGVTSNRVDIRRAEALTTQLIERVAEPLSALYLPPGRWPGAFLAPAWKEIIRNSAHDSICACSVDEVGRAVIHRFDEAAAIAQGVADRALAAIAVGAWSAGPAPVIVNPAPRTRTGLVEVSVGGADPVEGTQTVSTKPARRTVAVNSRSEVEQMAAAAIANMADLRGGTVVEDGDTLVVTLVRDGAAPVDGELEVDAMLDALRAAVTAGPGSGAAKLDMVGSPRQQVLARVEVPGFGWARWSPTPLDVVAVVAGPTSLDNGILRVEVDDVQGTWSINGQPGFGRLVDEGDIGDTYNWCPDLDGRVVDHHAGVTVQLIEDGPLRSRLAITTTWHWPERAEAGHRVGERTVDVRTTLELRAGDDVLRVTHDLDNRCDDHRLRVWHPLPSSTDRSRAESPFTVVERGLTAEGGPSEQGLPTFPSRRFVAAGGLTVVHDGVTEYELVDVSDDASGSPQAHAIALTVLRATGIISALPMETRPVPAGPQIASPEAQVHGYLTMTYALHVGDRDPFELADDVLLPLIPARSRPGAVGLAGIAIIAPPLAPGLVEPDATSGSALTIDGAEVSAVVRTDGRLTVRLYNPRDEPATVRIEGRKGWLVDLRGRALEPFENRFDLHPHGIATVALDD